MKMMGYTGGGLGLTGEGRVEPIQVGRLEDNEGVSLHISSCIFVLLYSLDSNFRENKSKKDGGRTLTLLLFRE
jgi:hypothetical protein